MDSAQTMGSFCVKMSKIVSVVVALQISILLTAKIHLRGTLKGGQNK